MLKRTAGSVEPLLGTGSTTGGGVGVGVVVGVTVGCKEAEALGVGASVIVADGVASPST